MAVLGKSSFSSSSCSRRQLERRRARPTPNLPHTTCTQLEGAVTVGLAIVFAFILPSSPATCPLLSETERELLLWRIKTEQGAADKRDELSAFQAFSLALVDPKTWCFIGILYST